MSVDPRDQNVAVAEPEQPLVGPPKPGSTYDRILTVVKWYKRPIAPHEFNGYFDGGDQTPREFVGCSEATLARRCREMVGKGWLTVRKREGKNFVEYGIVV